MTERIVRLRSNPGCLVQVLWFLVIGLWLGQMWVVVAWLLMLTVVGLPLSAWMLNRVPEVVALRGFEQELQVVDGAGGAVVVGETPQVNILLRAIYFLLIGWWLSALWMEAAFLLCATVIGMPIGFIMFDMVPAIVSLRR